MTASATAQAEPPADQVSAAIILKLRAEVWALLWSSGQIGSIPGAVDPLQEYAEQCGLVLKIGQDAVQQILSDAFLPYREAEWQAVAALEQTSAGAVCCDTCGSWPCVNPSFCAACRAADAGQQERTTQSDKQRPIPTVVIEAIMHTVRERGPQALSEATNLGRLSRCDADALAEIDRRMSKLPGPGDAP